MFDGRKCDSDENSNKTLRQCKWKKSLVCEKDYLWSPITCTWKK